MDPTTTLETILRLSKRIVTHIQDGIPMHSSMAEELAEACLNLDKWISFDGCLPKPWAKARDEAH